MNRHKYHAKSEARLNENGSIVQCVKCGCIREYIRGKPTYFINDSVYLIAPKCKGTK